MQAVSTTFSSAINDDNREMHGYVIAQYQNEEYDTTAIEYPTPLEIVRQDGSGLVVGEKMMNKYATLEENYTLLDGSFMVWNENRLLTNGFVSNDIFSNIQDSTIVIQNNTVDIPVKGITIYFRENLPFDFSVTFTDDSNNTITDNVENNTSMIYQYIFNEEKNISEVALNISSVEFPNQRIRISCIDFNIGDLYEGEELINFEVSERIDLLSRELPVNSCSVNLNNYPNRTGGNKFDPINPVGITKYLTNDSTLEPYIGVLTEDNGVEYVKMGTFYINDWSSNPDGNVTINGKNLIYKLKTDIIHSTGTFCYNGNNYWNGTSLGLYLSNVTGYTFEISMPYDRIYNDVLKHMEIMDYLRIVSLCSQSSNVARFFHGSRDNKVKIEKVSSTEVARLSRKQIKNDVDYKVNQPVKKIEFTSMKNAHNTSTGTKDVLNLSYGLNQNEEYIWIPIDNVLINLSPSFQKTFTYTTTGTGTAELIDCNDRMAYIHLSGDIGEVFTLHLTTNIFEIDGNITTIIDHNATGETISVDISEYFRMDDENKRRSICNGLINTRKKYSITAETFGNPSIEVGDVIAIQTRYGENSDEYKKILITKQDFTYDGGLTCHIEGIGD